MAVSGITEIQTIEAARSLAAFSYGSDLYALWVASSPTAACCRFLTWRKHGDSYAKDVRAPLLKPFETPSAVVRFDGVLLVAYADSASGGSVWVTGLDLASGAVVFAPRVAASGATPSIMVLPGARAGRVTLVYLRRGEVYVRESVDGGKAWSHERPVLSMKVQETTVLGAVPFDEGHVSVAQVGSAHRVISEVSAFVRTRPVTALAPSPVSGRFYAAEASQRSVSAVAQLHDSTRGHLAALATGVLGGTRTRVGAEDGISELMLLDAATGALALVSSSAMTSVAAEALFGASAAAIVDVVASGDYGYFAGYTDEAADGALAVMRLSDGATSLPLTGVPVHALAVAGGLLAAATSEGAGERLRLYSEGGLAPALAATHRLPLRANGLTFDAAGRLLVCGGDRLNTYAVDAPTRPIRLVDSRQLLTGGTFHRVEVSSRGFLVAAAGAAGVRVFAPSGETVASLSPSGVAAPRWQAGKARLVGDLVRPTPGAPYAYARSYFRCTAAGTSGTIEPPWTGTQPVPDGGATWIEMGPATSYVTDVALDEPRHRILAAGLAGGPTSTAGRVWLIGARQVLP